MAIQRADFDAIDEADLQELIAGQVAENLRIEFKLTVYGGSDADKRELLKDVSALANTHGGHLILGIEETGGVATNLTGLVGIDTDAEIQRMEQILRSGLEPPVSGIRMKAISLANGRSIILIRVPRSWNPPHRVVANRSNRFYIRHSAGIHEPSVEELRVLFTQSTSALDHARQFRDERIRAVSDGEGMRPLVGNGRLFIHIVPSAAFSGMVNLDVATIHDRYRDFRPIAMAGMMPRYNFHGFINEHGGEHNQGYTQVFRNGCLEAALADLIQGENGEQFISGTALENEIFDVFSSFIEGLRDIGVPPPLIIMVTFQGVRGARYAVHKNTYGGRILPLPEDLMRLPECILEDYGTTADHHRAVKPAFDALWNAIGHAGSQYFGADGLWRGPT